MLKIIKSKQSGQRKSKKKKKKEEEKNAVMNIKSGETTHLF